MIAALIRQNYSELDKSKEFFHITLLFFLKIFCLGVVKSRQHSGAPGNIAGSQGPSLSLRSGLCGVSFHVIPMSG